MKKLLFILLGLNSVHLFAQSPSDCIGAVPICDSIYSLPVLPSDTDNYYNEINPLYSCLNNGDVKGRWYKFGVLTNGNFGFTIEPVDTTYDFDWALFKLNNASCADIYGDTSLAIRCDFSGVNGNNGSTGADGIAGVGHHPLVAVDTYTILYLYVSTEALGVNDTAGYTINLTSGNVVLDDCGSIGLDEQEESAHLILYPNPVADRLMIFSEKFVPVNFHLMDLSGKTITMSGSNWNYNSGIDFSSIQSGIYFCTFTDAGGREVIRKVVKP